jgi:hypothetical protein
MQAKIRARKKTGSRTLGIVAELLKKDLKARSKYTPLEDEMPNTVPELQYQLMQTIDKRIKQGEKRDITLLNFNIN